MLRFDWCLKPCASAKEKQILQDCHPCLYSALNFQPTTLYSLRFKSTNSQHSTARRALLALGAQSPLSLGSRLNKASANADSSPPPASSRAYLGDSGRGVGGKQPFRKNEVTYDQTKKDTNEKKQRKKQRKYDQNDEPLKILIMTLTWHFLPCRRLAACASHTSRNSEQLPAAAAQVWALQAHHSCPHW